MEVRFQGNVRCLTGEDGLLADHRVRQFIRERRYQFMALDMHCPDTLEGRLEGLQLLSEEFREERLDHLTVEAPQRLIL